MPLSQFDAADLLKVKRGFLVAGFIGAFQADEAGEGGSVPTFQSEDFVCGMVALFLAGVVIVGASQGGAAENAQDLECLAALADFPGFGLVGGIDLVSGFLDKLADKLRGGFENGGAQQLFEIGDKSAAGLGGAEGGD